MSAREINERRNWKAQTFPYEHFTVNPGEECCYCLTDKQAEILLGIIEPLGWRTRWWTEGDGEIDQEVIEQFRSDLARRLMMGCCGDSGITIQYRYNEDGLLEKSEDGGVTWQDASNDDPRLNSPQFPPPSGEGTDTNKCIAAAGMVALIKDQVVDNLTDEMTRYEIGQVIKDWVTTFINTANPLQAIITVVSNQIFALAIAVIKPALTDDVYDNLKCIFDCTMSDDCSFTISQWQDVRGKITDEIGGIAGVFFEHLVYLLGAGGLTNLARASGATDGDCSECECNNECSIDFWYSGIVANGGIFYPYAETSRSGNQIVIPSFDRGDGTQEVSITTKLADVCCGFHVTTEPEIDLGLGEFYVPCGTSADYEHIVAMGVTPTTTPMNTYQIVKGIVPFVATFTFDV